MILVTGGTGFVGRHLAARLLAAGLPARLLARHRQEVPGAEVAVGDVTDRESLLAATRGCDTVIHLVGIIRETRGQTFVGVHVRGTRNVLWACAQTGVRRLLHMSALGARANGAGEYLRTKWAAEGLVRQSGLAATIFRPSIQFGAGNSFFPSLRRLVTSPGPVLPIAGRGDSRFQPIWVEDVATCFLAALDKPDTIDHTYELCGLEAFTFEQLVDLIAEDEGTHKRKVHLPVPLIWPAAAVMDRVMADPLVTPDQLAMLATDNTCADNAAVTTFGLAPAPLLPHLRD